MDVELLVKELQQEMPGVFTVEDIDISEDFPTAQKYGVQSTPTVILLNSSGTIAGRAVGVPDKTSLKAAIQKAAAQ